MMLTKQPYVVGDDDGDGDGGDVGKDGYLR